MVSALANPSVPLASPVQRLVPVPITSLVRMESPRLFEPAPKETGSLGTLFIVVGVVAVVAIVAGAVLIATAK